jgi:hypothetical protein
MRRMPTGWTIEVTTEHWTTLGRRLRSQVFDVAIEDKEKALEAAKHHARATIIQIVAKDALDGSIRLSPGRIKSRRKWITRHARRAFPADAA